jgi:hypothetical protein
MNVFAVRAAELADNRPSLTAAVEPLLKTREAVERQIADLDRKVLRLARNNGQVQAQAMPICENLRGFIFRQGATRVSALTR